MTSKKSSIVLTAAFAGLLGGTMARVNARPVVSGGSGHEISSASSLAGQSVGTTMDAKKAKHACKGMNSCKGNGGCSTGDAGCKGKNTCKGKGGCATDGKMDTKKK